MNEPLHSWPKHLTVDKRIVKILSGSTYANFPSAIREIIVNSYDADAESVWVDIDAKKEIISIRDDGKGMSEEDFSFYLRIAGKSRKKDNQLTPSKRQIVGQFGVGFLSALPFCEKYLIETKKKGTDEIVHATIDSTDYFNEKLSNTDVEEIPIFGGIRKDHKVYHEQFTRIRLVGFSRLTTSFFRGEYSIKSRRSTINNYLPIQLFKWELCEYLPIDYNNETEVGRSLNKLFRPSSKLPFNVFLNGEKLYRNIHSNNILEASEEEKRIGEIRFKYAILTNYKPIDPSEARYLMLRNLNVGVGERTTFDLGMDGKIYGKLAHLTGEVFITEGLNDLISVSRDKFNFSPAYEKLKDFLRSRLARWANELDTLSSLERIVNQLDDTTKVTSISSLKKEKISQDINSLKNKGFTISRKEGPNKTSVKLNKEDKEVILPKELNEDYTKIIKVLDKEYKLVLKSWEIDSTEFPAIRLERNRTIVNEAFPLFRAKNQFDTFLKLNILLVEYLNEGKISKNAYHSFLNDLLKIFNK